MHRKEPCRAKQKDTVSQKQPLPDKKIQALKRHEKTVNDLPQTGELPIQTLKKQLPDTEFREM